MSSFFFKKIINYNLPIALNIKVLAIRFMLLPTPKDRELNILAKIVVII
ncbi:hypothetical protein JBKA6_0689 [Ichthyobacterium seriolicida]|uniref:Uncharacterized protein n=1 Tax=Ichthyobacterium seriolicida TaxID=242600 RepID=A0A1J1E5V4_9FLAO|nr:hypothetical protein JBKA6_0689 [Ichthyobacterium seriolicida]